MFSELQDRLQHRSRRRLGKRGDRTRTRWFAPTALTILIVGTVASAPIDTGIAAAHSSAEQNAIAAKQATTSSSWGATPSDPCDPLDPSGCMLPFPNDYYTVPSKAMPTGRQIYFPPGAFPTAVGSSPVNVMPWEQNDGFSPGSTILLHVPGLSLSKSDMATISRMGQSLDRNNPIVLLDATTGKRWLTWAELDSDDTDNRTQLLIIHPARNLSEGHRYIVALRNLKTASGRSIGPSAAFGASVLGIRYHASTTFEPLAAAYTAHLKSDLRTLSRAGVARRGLYVAWDFTVASRQNLTSPELDMRNEVFQQLGSSIPSYTVAKVVDDPKDNPSLAREVTGTFDVPSFLTEPAGQPGTELETSAGGVPKESGLVQLAGFDCEIPKSSTAEHPGHIGLYGHGLFNSSSEVYASAIPQFSNAYDFVFCGTDWYGLSSNTVALATTVVSNFGGFPSLSASLMQSLIDAEVLGKLMSSPDGFVTNSAFQNAARRPLVNSKSDLVYYGNSEGGIMGGAFVALSTEVRRAVLGVPGIDYAILLSRSADFLPFVGLLDTAYPSKATQQLGFDLIQMLWDRAEADGYAEQMTGGLPGTPSHQILLEEAFGDHQVANIATETEARTIGAGILEPALANGRSNERQPFWDIPRLPVGSKGPGLTVWDSGVPAAPLTDTPPVKGPDPHDTVPRTVPASWRQMNSFFTTGRIIDPCGDAPCRAPYPPRST